MSYSLTQETTYAITMPLKQTPIDVDLQHMSLGMIPVNRDDP